VDSTLFPPLSSPLHCAFAPPLAVKSPSELSSKLKTLGKEDHRHINHCRFLSLFCRHLGELTWRLPWDFTPGCGSFHNVDSAHDATGRRAVSTLIVVQAPWTRPISLTFLSHKSMIAYLSANKYGKSAAILREEMGIGDNFDDATCKKYEGLIERKWTSVVRLHKKVSCAHFVG
jgi:hypothetical protein